MVSMLFGAWSPEDFLGVRSVQASSPGLKDQATGSRAPFALARACERLYVPCTKRDDAADTYGVGFVSRENSNIRV